MSESIKTTYEWREIPWRKLEISVFKLQKRIYKASENGDVKKVHKLQRLMMKSKAAKLIAVRRVTQDNQGKKTAGIDGIKSLTPHQRITLAENLGNLPMGKPTRRVWIPKPGKEEKRPLGIPTMNDRALQAQVKIAMESEWEAKFEPNSYGFRPGRSVHDAIEAIHSTIVQKPKYVLDADIAKCFDRIDHQTLLNKINTYPTLNRLINKWLKAGVFDKTVFAQTEMGTPQGGVISPLLANIALEGLEEEIKNAFPRTIELGQKGKRNQVLWQPQIIRYADDFVILHRDKRVIEQCKEIAEKWLGEKGLEISQKKTRIAHTLKQEAGITGFDFLGFNIRQYKVSKYNSKQGFKTLIKPSKAAIKRHYQKLSDLIDSNKAETQEGLINLLNPVISGWCRYYSTVVSKEVFQKLDQMLYEKLKRWAKRRHPKKTRQWIVNKYWHPEQGKGWKFSTKKGFSLLLHTNMSIIRHIKVKGKASPFNGEWNYWAIRRGTYLGVSGKITKLMKIQKGRCKECELFFTMEAIIEIHHLDGNRQNNKLNNLAIAHRHCHDRIHSGLSELSKLVGTYDKS